jgi:predicted dehydrogenase
LRIATVGLSVDAVFHLEAAAIHQELIPVAAARIDEVSERSVPIPGCSVCSIEQLAERLDVEAVFVCGPVSSRIDNAVRMLRSGKHVVVEPSSGLKPDQFQWLIDEAATCDRFCAVWRPYHAEPDFRRAEQVVASTEAGRVRAVRFMRHDMAAAMLPGANSPASRDYLTDSTLSDLVGHRIAQTLALVNEPMKAATAMFGREPICFGNGDSAQRVAPAGNTMFHAFLEFENGATASLDIGLSCPVPISTGWIVQASQGGYHSGRQHITVEDGELYDVAVDIEPFDLYLKLHRFVRRWPRDDVRELCQRSLHAELAVADVLREILDLSSR